MRQPLEVERVERESEYEKIAKVVGLTRTRKSYWTELKILAGKSSSDSDLYSMPSHFTVRSTQKL